MMAAALGTGIAMMGAALMFAFTLGTSVLFFVVAYLATQLGARLEKYFMTFVAITVLVFVFITINSALNLMGSMSYENITRRIFPVDKPLASTAPPIATESAVASSETGVLKLSVENGGYFPQTLHAKADSALTLALITQNTRSCARDFVIPALEFYTLLPETPRNSRIWGRSQDAQPGGKCRPCIGQNWIIWRGGHIKSALRGWYPPERCQHLEQL